jgi:hypothetical protein
VKTYHHVQQTVAAEAREEKEQQSVLQGVPVP